MFCTFHLSLCKADVSSGLCLGNRKREYRHQWLNRRSDHPSPALQKMPLIAKRILATICGIKDFSLLKGKLLWV